MSDARAGIGVDLGGTKLNAAVIDASGRIHYRTRRPTGPQRSNHALLELMADAVAECLAQKPTAAAVGVGCAGQTDFHRGELVFANNLGVRNLPIARELGARLALPVAVDNDVNAIGLGEARFGAGRGASDLVAVFVGTGIGGGFVAGGQVVRGKSGVAAEVGHTIFIPGGRPCNCGQLGCFEAYCSGRAFEEIGAELRASGVVEPSSGAHFTSQDLRAAARGSEVAAAHLARAEQALALLCANLTSLMNPEVLVLGGGVVLHDHLLARAVETGVAQLATEVSRRDVRVAVSSLGEDAALLGAAALAFEQLRQPPAARGH
jgi:glucokinase